MIVAPLKVDGKYYLCDSSGDVINLDSPANTVVDVMQWAKDEGHEMVLAFPSY